MRQTDPDNSAVLVCDEGCDSRSSLVHRAPFGICRSSLSRDQFKSANPALCRMLGYSEEELLSVSISEQVFCVAPNRMEIADLLQRDNRLNAHETSLRRKDGSIARVRVTAYLTKNAQGEVDDVESYIEDLTEQSVLEQQIRAV